MPLPSYKAVLEDPKYQTADLARKKEINEKYWGAYDAENPQDEWGASVRDDVVSLFDAREKALTASPLERRALEHHDDELSTRIKLRVAAKEGMFKTPDEFASAAQAEDARLAPKRKEISDLLTSSQTASVEGEKRRLIAEALGSGNAVKDIAGTETGGYEAVRQSLNDSNDPAAGAAEAVYQNEGDLDKATTWLNQKLAAGRLAARARTQASAFSGSALGLTPDDAGVEAKYGADAMKRLDALKETLKDADPVERKRIIKDAAATVAWGDERTRKLSTGELAINPQSAFGDKQGLIDEINKSDTTPANKELALMKLEDMRGEGAGAVMAALTTADLGFQSFVEAKKETEGGIGDPAALLDEWTKTQQGSGWWKKVPTTVLGAVTRGVTGIGKTAVGTGAGVASLWGGGQTLAQWQQELGDLSTAQTKALETRGLKGGYAVATDFIDSLTQMAPMFSGAVATGGSTTALAAWTRMGSVVVTAGAQGFESKLSDAAELEAQKIGRPLDPKELTDLYATPKVMIAALANAIQTAGVNAIMPGGAEAGALGKVTVKDFLAAGGANYAKSAAFKNAVTTFVAPFIKHGTSEFVEEFVNQTLDKAISIGVLGETMKIGDLIHESLYAGVMGFGMGAALSKLTHNKTTDELETIANASAIENATEENISPPVLGGGPVTPPSAEEVAELRAERDELSKEGYTPATRLKNELRIEEIDEQIAAYEAQAPEVSVEPTDGTAQAEAEVAAMPRQRDQVQQELDVEQAKYGTAEFDVAKVGQLQDEIKALNEQQRAARTSPVSPAPITPTTPTDEKSQSESRQAEEVLTEPAAGATQEVAPVADIKQKWEAQGVVLDISTSQGHRINDPNTIEGALVVDRLKVPEDQQRKGVGSAVLTDLKQLADTTGRPVEVLPVALGKQTVQELENFYTKNGFVPYDRGEKLQQGFRYTPQQNENQKQKASGTPSVEGKPVDQGAAGQAEGGTAQRKSEGQKVSSPAPPVEQPTAPLPEGPPTSGDGGKPAVKKEAKKEESQKPPTSEAIVAEILRRVGLKQKNPGTPEVEPNGQMRLFQGGQGPKGSFDTKDAKFAHGLMTFYKGDNPSTALHEFWHFLSENDFFGILTPEEITQIRNWERLETKVYNMDAREKGARGFEKFFWEGKSTGIKSLDTLLEKLKKMMREVYAAIKGSEIDIEISPEIRALMNKLLTHGEKLEKEGKTPIEVDLGITRKDSYKPPVEGGKKITTSPTYSPKNKVNAAMRRRYGMSDFNDPATQGFDAELLQAEAERHDNPNIGVETIQDLDKTGRIATPVELAHLMYEAAAADATAVYHYNKVTEGDTDSITKYNDALIAIDHISRLLKDQGTKASRALGFRRILVNRAFERVTLENQLRADNKGGTLSEEQKKRVAKTAKDYKEADAEVNAAAAATEKARQEGVVKETIKREKKSSVASDAAAALRRLKDRAVVFGRKLFQMGSSEKQSDAEIRQQVLSEFATTEEKLTTLSPRVQQAVKEAVRERTQVRDIADGVSLLNGMTKKQLEEVDPYEIVGGSAAYSAWEASKLLPKPSDKLKRVTDNNSRILSQDWHSVANVDGELYGVAKYEDPDAESDEEDSSSNPKEYVWAYAKLTDPYNVTETTTRDVTELITGIKNSQPTTLYQQSKKSPESARLSELKAKHKAGTITEAETKEAEAIVAERAKKAGYNQKLFHGSPNLRNIQEFRLPEWLPRSAPGYIPRNRGAFFFSNDPAYSQEYTTINTPAGSRTPEAAGVGEFFLSASNTFEPLENEEHVALARKWFEEHREYAGKEIAEYFDTDTWGPISDKRLNRIIDDLVYGGWAIYELFPRFQDFIKSQFDSYAMQEGISGQYNTLAVFNPSQIKSADPFIETDLDQRFDTTSPSTLFQSSPLSDLDPEVVKDLVTYAKGFKDLKSFTASLIKEFGPEAEPYATALFNKAAASLKKAQRSPKEIARDLDPDQDLTGRVIANMVRGHLTLGTPEDQILPRIHEELQSVWPMLTPDEVVELFTNYGQVTYPSQEEISKKARALKALKLAEYKLAKLLKGILPESTGAKRDPKRDEVRALEKAITNEYKRLGLKRETETQIKTPLDNIQTRIKNEIKDRQEAIKSRTPVPPKTDPVAYDAETTALKAELDKVREEYAAIFDDPAATEAQKLERAIKALDRLITKEEEMAAAGILKNPTRDATVFTDPQYVARKQKLADLRKARTDAYQILHPKKTRAQILHDAALAAQKKGLARDKQIVATGTLPAKQKRVPQYTPNAEFQQVLSERETLADLIKELRDQQREAEKLARAPQREATKLARDIKAAQASLDKLDAQILALQTTGALPVRKTKTGTTNPVLATLRAARKDRVKVLARLERAARQTKTPREQLQERRIKALERSEKEYADKLARGDFTRTTRVPEALNKAEADAKFKRDEVVRKWNQDRQADLLANATRGQKNKRLLGGVWRLLRLNKLGYNFITLLQGLPYTMRLFTSLQWVKLAKTTKSALMSYSAQNEAADYDLMVADAAAHGANPKTLRLVGPNDADAKKEDLPDLDIYQKIIDAEASLKVLGRLGIFRKIYAIERINRSYLNHARLETFKLTRSWTNRTPTEEELDALGQMAEVATGRGQVGKDFENAIPWLNNWFFNGVRYNVAQFQDAFGYAVYKAPWRMKLKALDHLYIRPMLGSAIMSYASSLLFAGLRDDDDEEERKRKLRRWYDIREQGFGKVPLPGGGTLDLFQGKGAFVHIVSNNILGYEIRSGGEKVPLRESGFLYDTEGLAGKKVPFGQGLGQKDLDFVLNRANVVSAAIVRNFITRKQFGGDPVTWQSGLKEFLMPLIAEDAYEVFKRYGWKGMLIWFEAVNGAGLNIPPPKVAKPSGDTVISSLFSTKPAKNPLWTKEPKPIKDRVFK